MPPLVMQNTTAVSKCQVKVQHSPQQLHRGQFSGCAFEDSLISAALQKGFQIYIYLMKYWNSPVCKLQFKAVKN